MAATAVGLFADTSIADSVVDALRAHGIPDKNIRTLAQPAGLPVNSATSTPSVDFAAALAKDFRSMGATEPEIEGYLSGVRRGNVLIFVSGTLQQADAATAVMNQFTAIEIEEFAGVAPTLPSVHVGEVGLHDASSRISRERAKTDGARLFSW